MASVTVVGNMVDLTDDVEVVRTGEDNNGGEPRPLLTKPRTKKGKSKKAKKPTVVKVQPKEEPTEEAPHSKKRRRTTSAMSAPPPTTRRGVQRADYDNVAPEDEEWYDAEDGEWQEEDWPEGGDDDTYPYPMWNLMYEDINQGSYMRRA